MEMVINLNNKFQDRQQHNAKRQKNKKIVNQQFYSPVKSEKNPKKKDKNAFGHYSFRIPLQEVYFSHFIGKPGTIFKDICIN